MRRRGFIINAAVLILIIPLILLAAVYENASSGILKGQSQNVLLSRDAFAVSALEQDFQNALDLSLKRAYLSLTDYVIKNGLLTTENASYALKQLMVSGDINGIQQKEMKNVTLDEWFNNLVSYLKSLGLRVYPSTPQGLLLHLNLTVTPLDSFHMIAIASIRNVTIVDASGKVMFQGNIPPKGYAYSIISVIGFEDPLLPSSLNGIYTRIIQPCSIPYPGSLYGYYNVSNVTELTMGWCYLGVNATALYNGETIYYPTILDRFESVSYQTYIEHQQAYLRDALQAQRELGIKNSLPVGLITFLVPSSTVDPTLTGALESLYVQIPSSYDSVAFFFVNSVVDKKPGYPSKGSTVNSEYPAFKLDNVTKMLIFNTTG